MWNDLRFHITSAQSLAFFRQHLKTSLLSPSYADILIWLTYDYELLSLFFLSFPVDLAIIDIVWAMLNMLMMMLMKNGTSSSYMLVDWIGGRFELALFGSLSSERFCIFVFMVLYNIYVVKITKILVTSFASSSNELSLVWLCITGWLTIVLQCYDAVGCVTWRIKLSPKLPNYINVLLDGTLNYTIFPRCIPLCITVVAVHLTSLVFQLR